LARYKLDLLGVHEVGWDKGGTVRMGYYNFFYVRKMKINNSKQDFFKTQNNTSS